MTCKSTCGEGDKYCSDACHYAALKQQVTALPSMTDKERVLQGIDFAYGNLACSTNHKPVRSVFQTLATARGLTLQEFNEWAKDKPWRAL